MKFEQINQLVESKILPLANKLGKQRHLRAIRDSFISILPITLVGGVFAVLSAAPVNEETTNVFLLAWGNFASKNSVLLSWVNAVTLGAMSLYICIGITHFLTKHYKMDSFVPILLAVAGFVTLVMDPIELGFASKSVEINYIDGKGLIPAILIGIFTAEVYRYMRKNNWGRIKLPDSVPASLNEVFASLFPGALILIAFILVFAGCHAAGSTLPGLIYKVVSPTFKAADSLGFTICVTLLLHVFWFFGIHDAAFAGILGPIRDGNLSVNAAAKLAGEALPFTFTTSFWVYFVIIGGCGSVLSLAILLCFSKSKQLKTVGRIGLLPALFGISEPIIFGVPLMLNLVFLIPFLLASTLNGIISFLLIDSGIIGKTFAMLSWNMPSVFGAFLSTLDIKAAILIIALIVLDMLVYFPFFKAYEKSLLKMETEDTE
ncbi:PTS sugar transporter subunit IIC [Clostridium sp. WB02_MRS01]|uniref:PTS sugar transporter subunit IIC n=1 Tax=Clostridium sp. WB02_MRS01 TaxID=2605777 RepID=UPI0012B1E055|nr:PTS transporter subunit EIIC [Clostridium sp. WB02_MRS01]MSS11334.1 PTS sugar transporter subunit IIC [Clostridium sp. WB02_MRS01]